MKLIKNHEIAETLDDIETWINANEYYNSVLTKDLKEFINELRAKNGINKNV